MTHDPQSGAYQPERQPEPGPGNQLSNATPMSPYAIPVAKRSRKPLIFAILAALLVLCCGGTAIAAAVGGGKSNTTPTATATAGLLKSASPSLTRADTSNSPTLAPPSA